MIALVRESLIRQWFRVSLPATVDAELELNSVIPPPDKNKEEQNYEKAFKVTAWRNIHVTLKQLKAWNK